MTLQSKLGIAALTLGSGGVATYAALVPKVRGTEIRKLIEEKFRHILLDTKDGADNKDTEQWGKNWDKYQKDNKDNTLDTFGLTGWAKGETKDLKDELRKKCEELAKKEVPSRGHNLYQNVTKYCVRGVTVEDQANKEKLSLLDTNSSNNEEWTKVAGNKDKLKDDFAILGINAQTDKNYKPEDIKNACKETIKKHKGEDRYEKIYQSYKKVCVTEAAKTES